MMKGFIVPGGHEKGLSIHRAPRLRLALRLRPHKLFVSSAQPPKYLANPMSEIAREAQWQGGILEASICAPASEDGHESGPRISGGGNRSQPPLIITESKWGCGERRGFGLGLRRARQRADGQQRRQIPVPSRSTVHSSWQEEGFNTGMREEMRFPARSGRRRWERE